MKVKPKKRKTRTWGSSKLGLLFYIGGLFNFHMSDNVFINLIDLFAIIIGAVIYYYGHE